MIQHQLEEKKELSTQIEQASKKMEEQQKENEQIVAELIQQNEKSTKMIQQLEDENKKISTRTEKESKTRKRQKKENEDEDKKKWSRIIKSLRINTLKAYQDRAEPELKAEKAAVHDRYQTKINKLELMLEEARKKAKSKVLPQHGSDPQNDAPFHPAPSVEEICKEKINPLCVFGSNHKKFPPLRKGSFINKVLQAPTHVPVFTDWPRSNLKKITVQFLLKLDAEYLKLQNEMLRGDEGNRLLFFEITFQWKFATFLAYSPELLLTKDDIHKMKVLSWLCNETKMLLKGTQGNNTVRDPILEGDNVKRCNVIRKYFSLPLRKTYTFECHIGRLIMYSKGVFPDHAGMDVSHLCERWWCMDVDHEHVKFEFTWLNQSVRKCHNKCSKKTQCECGMLPKCIFPKPHTHTNDDDWHTDDDS